VNARPLGAACIGVGGAALLRLGGSSLPVSVLGGLGATTFAAWRTVPGALVAYGLLLFGALAAWPAAGSPGATSRALPVLAALEAFGLATIAATIFASASRRVSRRMLGAWLASSGCIVLGLVLDAAVPTGGLGSALIAGGLAYKLGVVPAFAWAPLLLRHASTRITALGVAAFPLTLAALWTVVPTLSQPDDAMAALLVLSVVTVPWALWHVAHQWRTDARCARSYGAVLAAACLLVALVMQARRLPILSLLR
jgi:hypothetical protein